MESSIRTPSRWEQLSGMFYGQNPLDHRVFKRYAFGSIAVSVSLLAIGIIGIFIQKANLAIVSSSLSCAISCNLIGYNLHVRKKIQEILKNHLRTRQKNNLIKKTR